MIPIYLASTAVQIALVGRGERAVSRLEWLRAGGATPDVWSDEPNRALVCAAGSQLRSGFPLSSDITAYHLMWVTDLPRDLADQIAAAARRARILVNVEDARELCDFHTPALVRRGALTLTAGTGGISPAVARAARERLERVFPPEWGEALHAIAQSRIALRQGGAASPALVADAHAQLRERGLV